MNILRQEKQMYFIIRRHESIAKTFQGQVMKIYYSFFVSNYNTSYNFAIQCDS